MEQGQLFLSIAAALHADLTAQTLQFLVNHTCFFSLSKLMAKLAICALRITTVATKEKKGTSLLQNSFLATWAADNCTWVQLVFAGINDEWKKGPDEDREVQIILALQGIWRRGECICELQLMAVPSTDGRAKTFPLSPQILQPSSVARKEPENRFQEMIKV